LDEHPPTTLWCTRNKGRWVECVVRPLPTGVDVEVVVDPTPLVGRTFATSDEALEFAAAQRQKWTGRCDSPIAEE
jgi:hypothetical protein